MLADKMNGYPVIAEANLPDVEGMHKNRSIIMVDRGGGRYCVATRIAEYDTWNQGDYLNSLGEAQARFIERWKRG